MLAEDFNEVKGVEAEQQHQLVLTLSIITGSLRKAEKQGLSSSEKYIRIRFETKCSQQTDRP